MNMSCKDYSNMDFTSRDLRYRNLSYSNLMNSCFSNCNLLKSSLGFDRTIQTEGITCMAISPDGNSIAYGTKFSQIIALCPESEEISCILEGHRAAIKSIDYSSDSKFLLSISEDRTAILWNLELAIPIKRYKKRYKTLEYVSYTSSGDEVKILNPMEDPDFLLLKKCAKTITSAISADQKQMLIARFGNIKHVSLYPLKLIRSYTTQFSRIVSLAVSPTNRYLAAGSEQGTVAVWNTEALEYDMITLKQNKGRVNSIALSSSDRFIVSASSDNYITLWRLYDQNLVFRLKPSNIPITNVLFSPDETTILCALKHTSILSLNIEPFLRDETIEVHSDEILTLSFSPDCSLLVSCSLDKSIRIWDVRQGRLVHTIHGNMYFCAEFSPDSTQIAYACEDYAIRMYDLTEKQTIQTFNGHLNQTTSISFSPEGNLVVSGSSDSTIRVWNVHSAQEIFKEDKISNVECVRFSPDGDHVACICFGGYVKIWNIQTKSEVYSIFENDLDLTSIAYTQTGIIIALGYRFYRNSLWKFGETPVEIELDLQFIGDSALSQDGSFFAVEDNYIILWDIEERRISNRFVNRQNERLEVLACSTNGDFVANGCNKCYIEIWSSNENRYCLLETFDEFI